MTRESDNPMTRSDFDWMVSNHAVSGWKAPVKASVSGVSLLQLSPFFASIFPLFLQKRLILRLVGTSRRQGALSIMVCLALISHFSFVFFLAPEICGFDLPGFICSCRVSTSTFHSTYIQTRSTIPNHILSINIFNNEYRTIWGLNLRTWMFHVDSVSRRMVP